MPDLTNFAAQRQAAYTGETTSEYRKAKGQVFTPIEVARFMAGLFSRIPQGFRLLDPGAGAGLLSIAVCERILQLESPVTLSIQAYEPEPRLAEVLSGNLEFCRQVLAEAGHKLSFRVAQEDFVAAASPLLDEQPGLFKPSIVDEFDAVIMNPPYFKLRKDSAHARLMERVVVGQPNAYAFFLALGARLLKPNGELVAITPRSYCNGLYFRGFRKWFFSKMSLERLHLFESRTDTFKDSDVLQESVITKARKLGIPAEQVEVTGSYGKEIPRRLDARTLPHRSVVDNSRGEYLVKIPVSEDDCKIMRLIEDLPQRFEDVGLRISTGPVVTFRATDLVLRTSNGEPTVPLLLPHNVRPYRIEWPIWRRERPTYILDNEKSRRRKLLVPTRNYVVLKRFSAKEEKRRLTAACLIGKDQQAPCIGLENHLNYVYLADRELTDDETFGVAALFNSVLLDRYFRILSGNTQVNATEIRSMHFPSLDTLATIGRQVRELRDRQPGTIERIVVEAVR